MAHWLVKTEPDTYSFDQLVKDKKTGWDGVRNFQARNFLKAMKKGDQVLVYHSVSEKAVVGIAKVVRTAYPDNTAKEGSWVQVDLAPVKKVKNPITLAEIKKKKSLSEIHLVRQGRLSVMPLTSGQFAAILKLGK